MHIHRVTDEENVREEYTGNDEDMIIYLTHLDVMG